MRWCVKDLGESDESLVLRAREGDASATEQLLVRYQSAVRAQARRYFLGGGETEDLVQEGMFGLFGAIGSYNPESGKSFKNFAYLCVKRRIYDVLRAAGRQTAYDLFDPDAMEGGGSPEESVLEGLERAELRVRMMKALSDFEFRVVTMYLGGMKYAQICEATGKSFKSIDNALSRAKRKLQVALADLNGTKE